MGASGAHRGCSVGGRLRVGIGIKSSLAKAAVARPKTAAADFMGIGLLHDPCRDVRRLALQRRSGAAGKTGDGQVEAPPEEVHRTGLADEPRAKVFQEAVRLPLD